MRSKREALILKLLGNEEKYGLDLIRQSEGKLSGGTIYVWLARMEANGLITSRLEKKDPWKVTTPRRLYKVKESQTV